MDPSLWKLKCALQVTESLKRDNINTFVYAFNRNKNAKLYLPSTFQKSDLEVLGPKIET